MRDLGYGSGYRYAHDEAGAFAGGEAFFPDDTTPQRFYQPTDGGVEARIRERLAQFHALGTARKREDSSKQLACAAAQVSARAIPTAGPSVVRVVPRGGRSSGA